MTRRGKLSVRQFKVVKIALFFCAGAIVYMPGGVCLADTANAADRFRDEVQPILAQYCFDCHADGADEGDLAFDTASSEDALVADRELWWAVLKNVRAGLMPPAGEARPSDVEKQKLFDWIKTDAFGIDSANPDPGHVTVRRLNRAEYRNTISDLMGIDFNAEVVFPPDDTGFGFDNVGDAMSLSPLLLEKYLDAAKSIVHEAVPTQCQVIPVLELKGNDFRSDDGETDGSRMSYDDEATVAKTIQLSHAGQYTVHVEVRLHGSFDFDPSQCQVSFFADGEQLYQDQYAWDERKSIHYQFQRDWQTGEHTLSFQLEPLPASDQKEDEADEDDNTWVNFHILHVNVEGPSDRREHPRNYQRYFPRQQPPESRDELRQYAREVLREFAHRAYRRPVKDSTLQPLVLLAESVYQQPNKTFEAGVAEAMSAVLTSPRFLFRLEEIDAKSAGDRFPLIDEYSLASRLSYFLWSTMPDPELMNLAERGELRANFDAQIKRMLADERSSAFTMNFVGQWLRARDVEHVSLDPLVALGYGEEYEQLRDVFRRRFRPREGQAPVSDEEWEQTRARFRELREIRDKFDGQARRAMRRETEMLFEHIVREDRSVLELIDCDYTFLNERLADIYDIPGVEGPEMRYVALPKDSPRGGVLTQGTMLTVTSNPTRTSPVKRGLFILENILGTPPPPAPPNVPELEATATKFGDQEPSLRELLAAHRESELCSSCHSRMDPLGIALENFNALAMWRDSEKGLPIDASGELITGEVFHDVRELKNVLTTQRRIDFYRCMTQKLLTYALGRGIEDYDEFTVDEIVDQLEQHGGQFSVLLHGLLNSAPFQRLRPMEISDDE